MTTDAANYRSEGLKGLLEVFSQPESFNWLLITVAFGVWENQSGAKAELLCHGHPGVNYLCVCTSLGLAGSGKGKMLVWL